MKNFGFTLAEALITLGIIGVISALTIPSLIQNTATSEVGPKLAKAVSELEQANEKMLNQSGVDLISRLASNAANYVANLQDYLSLRRYKGDGNYTVSNYSGDSSTPFEGSAWTSKSGSVYIIEFLNSPSNNNIGNVYIDVDGAEGRSRLGEDVFLFTLNDNGHLEPFADVANNWTTQCSDETGVIDGRYCAGSIVDHNWKVVY